MFQSADLIPGASKASSIRSLQAVQFPKTLKVVLIIPDCALICIP
jgi:hypothetical protein